MDTVTSPPPPAPSLLDRLRGLRQQKQETHRELYGRLIRAAAGKASLSDHEIVALSEAAAGAGIGETQVESDIELVRRHRREDEPRAERLAALERSLTDLTAEFDTNEPEIVREFNMQRERAGKIADLKDNLKFLREDIQRSEQRRKNRPELFSE